MRQKESAKIYFKELSWALIVYMLLLIGGIALGKKMDHGLLRTLVLVSPMAGFLMMVWAIARQVRRMDEYMRLVMLESFAIASAITVGLSFTYGFLESAGFPRLSMFWVWGVLGASWALVAVVRRVCGDDQ